MMKIHILGSCSGTEPYPGRHHTAFAIELENGVYWFDAGETCSYTAYLMGIDLLKIRGIFISHCHMDHVGGLGNLLWNIRKSAKIQGKQPVQETIDIFIPYPEVFQSIMKLLVHTEDNFKCSYTHQAHEVKDGIVYHGLYDRISVEAVHNHHLVHEENTPWRSFAYRIYANGKVIVFSGDIELGDLKYVLPDECDMLLMETGHHKAESVCEYLKANKKKIEQLVFIHHGMEVLNNPAAAEKRAKECWSGKVCFADDAMSITLGKE